MVDRPGGSRDDDGVSEPVLDWLDEIAEAEGLSRDAALEYLVSSYWRLEEIVDLLEASEEPLGPDAPTERSAADDDRSDLDDLHARFDQLLDDLQRREPGPSEEDEFKRSVVELGERLERLEDALEVEPVEEPEDEPDQELGLDDRVTTLEARMERFQAAVEDDESSRQLEELADRLAGVEGRLDSIREAVDDAAGTAAVHELAAELDAIEGRFDSLQVAVDDAADAAAVDELAAELDAVEARFDSLAAEVEAVESRVEGLADEAVTEERLSALTQQTRSFQDSITSRHDSLHDRVHTEFTHIRTVLEHLLDSTRSNEGRLDSVVDEFEAALQADRAEREALAAITRTADRRGVSTAECERCGHEVDLSMLQSAECPSCEHAFSDIETTAGLFGLFKSSTLTVDDGYYGRG